MAVQASVINVGDLNDTLTKQQVEDAVNRVIVVLNKHYVFPEKSQLIENKLKNKLANNEFDHISHWYDFIQNINLAMRSASGGMYLDLLETKPKITVDKSIDKNDLTRLEHLGIRSTDVLSGNIGYLKLNYLYQNIEAEKEVFSALETLSQVDAMIIDLRDVEGDSISLAQYFMSFFVKEGVILSEVLYNKQSKKEVLKALENNGNDKFKHNFPIYILTSAFVSNSAEFLSYTLQHLGKAIIVGEKTMGVSYVLQKQKVNDHVSLNLPIAIHLPINNETHWLNIGVIPDIDVAAELSLETAHKMAKVHLGVF
jgi:C-terminal processing protease CtpA/Prc